MGSRFGFDFDNSDDDFDDEMDSFSEWEKQHKEELEDEEDEEIQSQLVLMQQEQVDLLRMEIDERLLKNSIKIASKSWFWSFKSQATKMKLIAETYEEMKKILDDVK